MADELLEAALVLVGDSARAILVRAKGFGDGVFLLEEGRLSPQILDNDGSSGSRPEEQTSRQTDGAAFAKQPPHRLYAMHHRDDFRSLVLVADPQTLSQLRGCMHKAVEASLVRMVAKDLTNLPVPEITAALGR